MKQRILLQQSSEVEETSRLDSKLINLADEYDDELCFSSSESDEVQAALLMEIVSSYLGKPNHLYHQELKET